MLVLALALCALLPLCPAVPGGVEEPLPRRLSKVRGFSWKDCGNGTDPFVVQSLSIAPDPICLPGDVKVSLAVSSKVDLTAPLKVVLTVEKKIADMWIKVPCLDQIGSCTYDDVCSILDNAIPPGTPCPEPLLSYGLPCRCPFKQGSYSLPPSDFYLPITELPSWLTNGDYHIESTMSNGAQQLACVKMALSLHSD
ncbi:ganglioside GM2 activator [Carettochelys insculpta]|uniref:ganglioside GM2 activator n=1 Tax=Carettochelys insculpta TaxID=44489 RepID=UPI003EBDFAF5